MKIQTITTIVILSMITIVSATYYAGDTIEIPLDFEIVNCSISNNTYNLDGLNLSWYNQTIKISTSPYYMSDSFLINCLVIKYGEIVEETYAGGSSGGGYVKDWSAECGYDKECLYGIENIDNSTEKNETIDDETKDNIKIEDNPKIEESEKNNLRNAILVLISLGIIGFILWKVNKNSKQ